MWEMSHVSCVIESCFTHTCETSATNALPGLQIMSYMQMRHDSFILSHIPISHYAYMFASCLIHEWVISYRYIRHDSHYASICWTWLSVTLHMCHVTYARTHTHTHTHTRTHTTHLFISARRQQNSFWAPCQDSLVRVCVLLNLLARTLLWNPT